jgi:hypothetical protein
MLIMPADVRTHTTTIEVIEPTPAEVLAGADIVLRVKVSCAAGCDLDGMPVRVTTADGAVIGGELGTCAGHDEATDITLEAPRRVGKHIWSVVFGPHEVAGIRHDEVSLPVRLSTIPRATSLAVWAIPSPVVMGERFAIKVGAKSSAGVALTGGNVRVCDESGAVVAYGCLGETPLPGTSALFWTDIELLAPVTEGMYAWSVTFEPQELELPHECASTTFSASIIRRPEHRLTIKVIEKDTAAPIADAQVRLGVFRAATDGSGLAEIEMPKGIYDLNVWKVGYEAPTKTVELDDNVFVEVEVVALPEENPDAAWLM